MTEKNSAVLIHGLFGHLNDPVILSAIDQANVFAPDLLGYGENAGMCIDGISLEDQADHIARFIESTQSGAVNLVGHSVGGAVAVLVAAKYPELLARLISVEGNFTLKDAFWSAQVAKKELWEVEEIVAQYRADPDAWISEAGVGLNEWTQSLARSWLEFQPPSTVRAQARAVVEATGRPEYLQGVRSLLASDLAFHLLAGEQSRAAWDVPSWVSQLATSEHIIPGVGHLMMAESPQLFGDAIRRLKIEA